MRPRTAKLLTQAGSIQKELAQRSEQLTVLVATFDNSTATAETRRDNLVARLRIVFGRAFVALPRFTPANADELGKALADSNKVQDGDPLASTAWFQRMARVRDGISRLNHALIYAEALGSAEKLNLAIAELPHSAEDRWVGLPLKTGQAVPGAASFPSPCKRWRRWMFASR